MIPEKSQEGPSHRVFGISSNCIRRDHSNPWGVRQAIFRVVVYAISGARGSGKSHLARRLAKAHRVISVEEALKGKEALGHLVRCKRIAVDGVNSLEEVEHLRSLYLGLVVHFHISRREFDAMPQSELELALAADYCASWEPHYG